MVLWLEQRWSQGFRCCCDWNKDEAKVLESCYDWNKDEAMVLGFGTKMLCCDWNKGEANKDEAKVFDFVRCCCDWNKEEAKVLDAVVIGTKKEPRF